MSAGLPSEAVVRTILVSLTRVEYEFWGERFAFTTMAMFALALVVGVIGGAYGIGGGATIAPFCVTFFNLPVYTIAGALFFSLIPCANNCPPMPDWPLGILFGLGGMAGMYLAPGCRNMYPRCSSRG